jgi:hypothetical protein
MLFSQDNVPHNVMGVVLWPAILFAMACAISYAAYKVEWDGKKAPWKWAALLPLVIGLIIGISALQLVTYSNYDILAYANNAGRKVTYSLWGVFALPIAGIAAFVGWQIWAKNQKIRY